MRRALTLFAGTVIGLVLLLDFKSGTPRLATTPPAAIGTPTPGPSPTTSIGAGGITKTVTGAAEPNIYGNVQVQIRVEITANGTRISAVNALQLPNTDPRSVSISQFAGPLLSQEAIAAQSAKIDIVSGATYTSDGYAQSLQSALDRVHG